MLKVLAWYEDAYSLVIRLYSNLVGLAAILGHRRAAALIQGRRHTRQYLLKPATTQGYVWFHASSAGELEQALPLMQAWREKYPEDPLLLSLYSPSAYGVGHCPPEADLCLMMSADLPQQVHQWIKVLRPRLAIFIKYDFWYHHFCGLHYHHIPLYIACAKLQPRSWWLHPSVRPLWSAMSSCVTEFWVQDQITLELLAGNGVHHAVLCGDTRYDRVLKLAAYPFHDRILDAFCQNESGQMAREGPKSHPIEFNEQVQHTLARPVMIGGSTWPADHRLLCEGLVQQHLNTSARLPQGRWKLILVPHEITPKQIQSLEILVQQISSPSPSPIRWQLYSRINSESTALADNLGSLDVLIIDQKGLLSKLYRYGQAAWIGGGFGAGIHNVLEAAVYGLPIGFGPRYQGFTEAEELLEHGFAATYSADSTILSLFEKKTRPSARNFYKQSSGITPDIHTQIKAFCQGRSGATNRCLERINKTLPSR